MEHKVIRSMCKLENVKIEVKRLNIDILGVSEIKWKDEGDFSSDNYS